MHDIFDLRFFDLASSLANWRCVAFSNLILLLAFLLPSFPIFVLGPWQSKSFSGHLFVLCCTACGAILASGSQV